MVIINQKLDYEGVPFRCRRYHEVGNIYRQYHMVQNFHGYREVGGTTAPKSTDKMGTRGNKAQGQQGTSQGMQDAQKMDGELGTQEDLARCSPQVIKRASVSPPLISGK